MVIFSEFYVLMFFSLMPVFVTAWDLISTPPGELSAALSQIHAPTPVILGMLVVFRFFPTMKAELRGVHQSMKNRRLTGPAQVLCHPAVTCEYVLVPLLLRCLQIADQLSLSAVARPGDGAYRAQRGGKDHAGKNSCGAGAPVPGRNPHPRPESIPGAAAEALLVQRQRYRHAVFHKQRLRRAPSGPAQDAGRSGPRPGAFKALCSVCV